MLRTTVTIVCSGLAAALFGFVPLFGLVFYGAVIQLLDMLGEKLGWHWLDLQQHWGAVIAWLLFTAIIFFGWQLYRKHTSSA